MAKISIKDIAREAGVSTASVSFVMNGKGKQYRVSDRMIAHIESVASRLNYQPNANARALRSGKTNTIGVIVSDISNPFFSEIVRCIEDLAFEKGWSVLFGSTDEHPEKMERLVQAIQNKGVDGWIIVPCVGSEAILKDLAQAKEPVVLLERQVPGLHFPTVCLDNAGAIDMAMNHLFRQGYERIQLMTYELPILSLHEREHAYKTAMQENGNDAYIKVHRLPFKLPTGTNGTQYIASMLPLLRAAEAIVCLTSRLSIMSIKAFQSAGVSMPQDIGFVGFDANDSFDLLDQTVTHIKQDPHEFGVKSFELLSDLVDQSETNISSIVLKSELIVGTSSVRMEDVIGTLGNALKDKFVQSIHQNKLKIIQ